MIRISFALAFMTLLVAVGTAIAAPPATVTVTSVGPGTNAGELAISGKYTVVNPWLPNRLQVQVSPAAGGTCKSYTVPGNPPASPWNVTITGLQTVVNYSVVGVFTVSQGLQFKTVLSDPVNGKAK